MYEEGGSDSDKPSLGDKPFWGHHHWGHHHWGGGAVTLAMLEDGGSSLDGQISTKAMYEEGGSENQAGAINPIAINQAGAINPIAINQAGAISHFGDTTTGDTTTGDTTIGAAVL